MVFLYVKVVNIACMFLLITCMLVLCRRSEGVNGTISAVVAFGDSILDTGNNNNLRTFSKSNFPPYGRDFPGGIPTGRFGNGRVFSDLIAEGLGVKEILPAYLDPNLQERDLPTGVCFASGGSGLDSITSSIQSVLSVSDQLNLFKQYTSRLEAVVGKETSISIISNSLFLISFGNNDIAITYFSARLRTQYTISDYTTQLVSLASTFVQELYGLGARRIGFMGTLPLGCLPAARAVVGGLFCQESVNQAAQMFNSKLASELTNINNSLRDAKIFYIDVYNPLLDIIRSPQRSGFAVASVGCCCLGATSCPFPSTNVFWDYAHPSEKAYRIMVNQILLNNGSNFN